MLKITHLYHSGFLLESTSAYVVCDFFLDGFAPNSPAQQQGVVPLVGQLRSDFDAEAYSDYNLTVPDQQAQGVLAQIFAHLDKPCYFLSSHFHRDHFNPFIFRFWDYAHSQNLPRVHFVLSSDIRTRRKKLCLPYIEQGAVSLLAKGESVEFADDHFSVEAFGSTDCGRSFLLTLDGWQIFHAGDLNEWHWQEENSPQASKAAVKFYERELEFIQSKMQQRRGFDVAMFPCDPHMRSNIFSGVSKLVHTIPTSVLVPMHMWEENQSINQALEHEPNLAGYKRSFAADCKVIPTTETVFKVQPPELVPAQPLPLGSAHGWAWIPAFSGDHCCLEKE